MIEEQYVEIEYCLVEIYLVEFYCFLRFDKTIRVWPFFKTPLTISPSFFLSFDCAFLWHPSYCSWCECNRKFKYLLVCVDFLNNWLGNLFLWIKTSTNCSIFDVYFKSKFCSWFIVNYTILNWMFVFLVDNIKIQSIQTCMRLLQIICRLI